MTGSSFRCTHCGAEIVGLYYQDGVRVAEASVLGGASHIVETEYEVTHCVDCHDRLCAFVPLSNEEPEK